MSTKEQHGLNREFVIASQAWHSRTTLAGRQPGEDDIVVTVESAGEDGPKSAEFFIEWVVTAAGLLPQIRVFDEGWAALASCQDVIEQMAVLSGERPNVDRVAEILRCCGLVDATPRVSPNQPAETVSADLEGLAAVTRVYQGTLNELREIIRKKLNQPTWGSDAENGAEFPRPASVAANVWLEFQHFADSVSKRRFALTRTIQLEKDLSAAKKHFDLLVSDEAMARYGYRYPAA